MSHAHRLCYEEINEECSKNAHKFAGVNWDETNKCVDESFEGSFKDRAENTIFSADAARWKEYGSAYWPAIIVNQRTFRGDLTPDNVFGAVCAGFSQPPRFCREFQESQGYTAEKQGVSGEVLIYVVVLLILVNVVLICLYKRCSNKELKDDMQL